MLSKPEHGQVQLTIKDFQTTIGDADFLPFRWLEICLDQLSGEQWKAVFQNPDSNIIVGDDATFIAFWNGNDEKNRQYLYFEGFTMKDFAGELVQDIEENFEDWVQCVLKGKLPEKN